MDPQILVPISPTTMDPQTPDFHNLNADSLTVIDLTPNREPDIRPPNEDPTHMQRFIEMRSLPCLPTVDVYDSLYVIFHYMSMDSKSMFGGENKLMQVHSTGSVKFASPLMSLSN